MLERARGSMRSMRAARILKTGVGRRIRRGSQPVGTGVTLTVRWRAAASTVRPSSISAAVVARRSGSSSSSRSGRPDSALTGLFRLSSSLPHCTARMSLCVDAGRPAADSVGSQALVTSSSSSASVPPLPRRKLPGPISATLKGTMADRKRRRAATERATSALCRPFCMHITSVPMGSARASAVAALGVALLLTHISTSAMPRPAGTSSCRLSMSGDTVAVLPSGSVMVRPCVRNWSRTRGRPTKCTSWPASARRPPR